MSFDWRMLGGNPRYLLVVLGNPGQMAGICSYDALRTIWKNYHTVPPLLNILPIATLKPQKDPFRRDIFSSFPPNSLSFSAIYESLSSKRI